jgi:hypothetical protein
MPAAPHRYLIVVPRPLPAAPLVVRRRYLIGGGADEYFNSSYAACVGPSQKFVSNGPNFVSLFSKNWSIFRHISHEITKKKVFYKKSWV